MQACADCGHTNRPGVPFCTQCGRRVASGATAGRPTSIIAAAVLAIGLLAFLTIRPMGSHETTAAVATASEAVTTTETLKISEQMTMPEATTMPEAVTLPELEALPESTVLPESTATPEPAETVPEVPSFASPLATPAAPAVSQPAQELEAAGPSVSAHPSPAPSLSPREPSSSPRESLSSPRDSLPSPRESPPSPLEPSSSPARASSLPPVPSSSQAKHAAAVGRAPSVHGSTVRPPERASWLRKLRAELDACEGNLIVRTVCAETAKLRYCTPADAWGEVPECPAARLPDLATFN